MKIFRILAGFVFIFKGLMLLATAPSATTATVAPTRFALNSEGPAHESQGFVAVSLRVHIPLSSSLATVSPSHWLQPPSLKTQIQIQMHANFTEE